MGKTILTPNQKRLLDTAATSEIITSHFYLTGGTALSEFYLHHRLSEDLDFFSENPLDETSIANWTHNTAKHLRCEATFQSLNNQLTYFFHFAKEVIKVDFAFFPFSPLGTPTKYHGLRIASIEDIATNKLQAIQSRTRGRDYLDLYEILNRQLTTLPALLTSYRLKFEVDMPPEQLARRLSAITEAADIPRFLADYNWQTIENFFLSEAKKLQDQIIR